jgi:hypothetical protein
MFPPISGTPVTANGGVPPCTENERKSDNQALGKEEVRKTRGTTSLFSTSAPDGSEWSVSRLYRLTAPGAHRAGGWVDPRVDLDKREEKHFITTL